MPPKRKRTEDSAAEAAPRATRTSSRNKSSATGTSGTTLAHDEKAKKSAKAKTEGGAEAQPAAKKTKRATVAAKKGKGAAQDESSPNESARTSPSTNGGAAKSAKTAAGKAPAKLEPYSEQRARELFKTYEDPDSPGEIGPEGFEKLCTDLEISLEGALPLVLAWQMHATEMAKFKESEWMQGTGELRVSSLQALALVLRDLEDLLLLDKPPIQPSGSAPKKKGAAASDASEPYSRAKYYQYAADKNKGFRELYNFCFALAKPPTSRNIDMETASAFWSVLVAPKYPIMKDILEFINEKGTYKGVTKDLWSMMLDFCKTMQPDLSNYSTDEAWPSMLDDFVAWKNPAAAAQEGNANVENDE